MDYLYTISDERTIFCRDAMKAQSGVWNPVTRAWMFGDTAAHANALCELYRATRASVAMREALLEMIVDGTAALAWGSDPNETSLDVDALGRRDAARLLQAGHAARRVLGTHSLEYRSTDEPTEFDASDFELRARGSQRRRRIALSHRRSRQAFTRKQHLDRVLPTAHNSDDTAAPRYREDRRRRL